jgi:CheY-like chemotaxis protein
MSSEVEGPAVLVVDDEDVVVTVVRRALESSGYRVITAVTGAEAVAACRAVSDIAVAVLDYGLRGTSGPALAASIRQLNPHVRILITSGLPQGLIDLPEGHGFLPKPFTPSALLKAVFSQILAYEAQAKHSS